MLETINETVKSLSMFEQIPGVELKIYEFRDMMNNLISLSKALELEIKSVPVTLAVSYL